VDIILVIFLIICALFVAIQIVALLRKLSDTKAREASISDLPKDKARFYIGLVASGSITKHIIVNFSSPRDDDAQFNSYASALNSDAVGALKILQGDNPFVTN